MLLYSIIAVTVTTFAGFFYGQHVQKAEDALEREKAIASIIDEHNANALIDMEAARAWGESNAKVVTKIVTIRGQTNEAIAAAPAAPICRVDDRRWRVLNAAIEVANDTPTAASRLLDATNKANATR